MEIPSRARLAEAGASMADRRMPPYIIGITSLKVDGISNRLVMGAIFEKYGRISDIYIPRYKTNEVNKGFALI